MFSNFAKLESTFGRQICQTLSSFLKNVRALGALVEGSSSSVWRKGGKGRCLDALLSTADDAEPGSLEAPLGVVRFVFLKIFNPFSNAKKTTKI